MATLKAERSEPLSLPDIAYNHVRGAIQSGGLESGAALKQQEIADRLGISQLPVREALRRLEGEGWVVLRPRRGYVVASLSRTEIEEVFEIQGMLEERGAYYAAQRRTQQDIDDLQARLDHLDALIAVSPLNLSEFSKANADFHEQLFEASGRPFFCRMLRTLRNTGERYARMGAVMIPDLQRSQAEHHAIMSAFRDGDAKEVARLCRVHRENTRDRLVESLGPRHD